MTKDKIAKDSYRALLYFYKNSIKVFFKDFDEVWYNGTILDLNEKSMTMVLVEDVKGTMPILLECVNPDSVRKSNKVIENGN